MRSRTFLQSAENAGSGTAGTCIGDLRNSVRVSHKLTACATGSVTLLPKSREIDTPAWPGRTAMPRGLLLFAVRADAIVRAPPGALRVAPPTVSPTSNGGSRVRRVFDAVLCEVPAGAGPARHRRVGVQQGGRGPARAGAAPAPLRGGRRCG